MEKKINRIRSILIVLMIVVMLSSVVVFWVLYQREQIRLERLHTPLFDEITIEAGEEIPDAAAFLKEAGGEIYYSANTKPFSTTELGIYPIEVVCNGFIRHVRVAVKDTIPPAAQTREIELQNPETCPEAETFVTALSDVTDVTILYLNPPDITKAGQQNVTVLLTDEGGNRTSLVTSLTITIDHEAPVISGVEDRVAYTGDMVSYKQGVTVSDDQDDSPVLEIDSSRVNMTEPGIYEVTYTAVDHLGNQSQTSCMVTVYQRQDNYVDIETIYEAVDAEMAKFLTEDMNVQEQVEAIYWHIRGYFGYYNTSFTDDWMQAAYRFLQTRSGDCYYYFSLAKLMMERLGIPNIDVVKVKNYPGNNMHYWSLVSIDGGETYYHFDITPRPEITNFLLVSDAYLDAYSAQHGNCFNRDKTLYPATPEEMPELYTLYR